MFILISCFCFVQVITLSTHWSQEKFFCEINIGFPWFDIYGFITFSLNLLGNVKYYYNTLNLCFLSNRYVFCFRNLGDITEK
jgi:hypothetical protein